jgi:hypothetical protein
MIVVNGIKRLCFCGYWTQIIKKGVLRIMLVVDCVSIQVSCHQQRTIEVIVVGAVTVTCITR